ncbi:MAG: hypothetical protein IK045_03815 [Bacteroidales bacterium]|nr:hypothetical protein [Bacteroidales bacterium]
MRARRIILSLAALLAWCLPSSAQFYLDGDDPGSLKWDQKISRNYRLIYPQAIGDSLPSLYSTLLEKYRPVVGKSIGMQPCSLQWGRLPVILHPYSINPNGLVVWAPKRMALYPVQESTPDSAMPGAVELVIHESRHVAQMQFSYRGAFNWLHYVLGEMWAGAVDGIYPDPVLLEGDAVVAETALSSAGRGRSAEFLEYYLYALAHGDYRNFWRWRYGSFRHYTPDHYRAGYLMVGGVRGYYDDPLFTKRYFDNVVRHPLRIGNFQKTIKEASGMKLKPTFRSILDSLGTDWAAGFKEREPFMPMKQITPDKKFYNAYDRFTSVGDKIYALQSGKDRATSLVEIDTLGNVRRLGPFGSNSGVLIPDSSRGRIYWREAIPDPRWSLSDKCIIRYIDLNTGRRHDLTKDGRFFNPEPTPDGKMVYVVEFPPEGGSNIVGLSAEDGSRLSSLPSPSGITFTEFTIFKGVFYALGVADGGCGVWHYEGGQWKEDIAPVPSRIFFLWSYEDRLLFVSDIGGVNELYAWDPASGKAERLTSTPFGSSDHTIMGDEFIYSALSEGGRMIFRTKIKDLTPVPADLTKPHKNDLADRLSAQEAELPEEAPDTTEAVTKRYRKFPHLLKIHSWAPVWFNIDKIASQSMDFSYETASLGATVLFQNDLGTMTGYVGYSAHKDPYSSLTGRKWKHSAHAKFTYTGLYPAFEASIDFNDRNAIQQNLRTQVSGPMRLISRPGELLGYPMVSGNFSVYLPLSFSKGGILSGFVPRINYNITNDRISTIEVRTTTEDSLSGMYHVDFIGASDGAFHLYQRLTASVRGYAMLPRAESQVYPRLGIGAEVGFGFRPGVSSLYEPNLYGYLYGYLPGITTRQGLKLSAMVQHHLGTALFPENYVSTAPRGYSFNDISGLFAFAPTQFKVSADYAIPVYVGDISCFSPVLYIKNFLLVPHCDALFFKGGNLVSAGVDITAELANILFLPFACSIGARVDVNAGSCFNLLHAAGLTKRVTAQLIFSVDI